MKDITELIAQFEDGSIRQKDLQRLFDTFLTSQAMRDRWPEEAAAIIPLALARKDAQQHHERRPQPASKGWKAAAVAALLLLAGTATVYAVEARPRIYSTDSHCDMDCAEKWLNNTLETAL